MKVEDPSGQVWRVSRRWLPWRRRGLKDAGTGDASAVRIHEIADAARRGVIPPRTISAKEDSGI